MNDNILETFIDLISFDQVTHTIQEDIDALKLNIDALRKEHDMVATQLNAAKVRLNQARQEVDKCELEMKTLEQKEAEQKLRIESTGTIKEHRAIKNEIAYLQNAQHDYETTILRAWNILEAAKKEFEQQQKIFQEHEASYVARTKELQDRIVLLQQQIQERQQERPLKEKKVPQEWLDKYGLMQSRVTNPVVPVVHGSCSACFYSLTDQELLALKRGRLLQCKECFRLLYRDEPHK